MLLIYTIKFYYNKVFIDFLKIFCQCQMFLEINRQLPDETNDLGEYIYNDEVYKAYCPRNELTGDHTCNSNIERINAGCILLLNMLFNIDDDILESENQDTSFAQYIILWLNHKLQQLPKSELIDLNNFYDKYIKDNEWYASFISEIDTQKELMNVDATMLSDLYYIFKEMCNKFSNTENHEDFTAYFYNNNNNNFVKTYEKLVTQFSASTMCSSYYTLLNDFKSSYEYFKDGHKDINLPELSCLKDIKEISKPNLEISDSQDSTDGNPESQDGGSENSNGTENSDQITPTNELGQQIEETKEDAIQSIYIDGSDVALPDLEDDLLYLNNETSKFYSNPPVYLDGFTVLDDESHVFMDDIEALDDEYPDNGIGGFKVNIDFLSIDDEFPNYDMVSSPLNIGLENNEIIVEDFETPQQPHQINTLIFDDPFENPKDFPDSIMCKLRGPKSVYCNRIICNKIKIGVIALSIPIILVFIYKVINKTITLFALLNIVVTTYMRMKKHYIYLLLLY